MQEPRRENRFKPLVIAAVVAVLIHLQLLLTGILPAVYDFWNDLFPRPPSEKTTEVTLITMNPTQFQNNRKMAAKVKVRKEPSPEEQPKPEEKKKPEKLEGQVVDVAPTPDDSPPKDARFLSEHNTNVKRESISRFRRYDYSVAQPRPTVAGDKRSKPSKPVKDEGRDKVALVAKKRGESKSSKGSKGKAFEIPDLHRRDALSLKLDLKLGKLASYSATDQLKGNSNRLNIHPGKASDANQADSGDQGKQDSTVAMFKQPSLDKLDMVSGAPANDHVDDVAEGEETLLNSKEFKYATFFNRVKRGVSQYWSPRVGEEYMRRDPYGNIYGVKDRKTLLEIALDPEGKLVDVDVVRSSGVKFFDDVAVQSFRDASPFPNPPKGLVEGDGKIHFQFGFYFMIGTRPTIRAFRFNRSPY